MLLLSQFSFRSVYPAICDGSDDYIWKAFTTRAEVEKNGLLVGNSNDGPVYVGGGSYGGQAAPGSLIFSRGFLYPYAGKVQYLSTYDYLVNTGNYEWVASSTGQYIKNSVIYGFMGVPVGRVFYNGEWQAGKICGPSCIYIASGDKEIKLTDYQALTYRPKGKSIFN